MRCAPLLSRVKKAVSPSNSTSTNSSRKNALLPAASAQVYSHSESDVRSCRDLGLYIRSMGAGASRNLFEPDPRGFELSARIPGTAQAVRCHQARLVQAPERIACHLLYGVGRKRHRHACPASTNGLSPSPSLITPRLRVSAPRSPLR